MGDNQENYAGYTDKETEIIKQFIQLRKEQKAELAYESLKGYEYPPRTQFSMLKKPAVSLKFPELTFNMACIKLFEGIQHILTFVNSERKRLAAVMCPEEEMSSVEWARIQKKDGAWVNKSIRSAEFVDKIFSFMDWDKNCRYKTLGTIVNSERGLCLLFDLTEAIMTNPKMTEYVDAITGETKKKRIIYYPDKYKGKIGKTYDDYAASQQVNIFESLEGYTGNTYNDFKTENHDNIQFTEGQENDGKTVND